LGSINIVKICYDSAVIEFIGKQFVILDSHKLFAGRKYIAMERIEALIGQLKQQFEQNADAAQLLGTVQLLQFELTKLNAGAKQSLGTAKVAVMLPYANTVGAVASAGAVAVAPVYEKYAPKPAEPAPVKEIKETVLLDEGAVSILQKNSQLDMVFDPMMEIPTLSHQPAGKEVNDAAAPQESLNDKLKYGKTELVEILKEAPVKDLRKAVGINDRFLFINELFRGDENMYERCIKTINNFNIYAEAEYWISRELKLKLGWSNSSETVQSFDQLVKRRFS
jgi:hypothetical protein